MRARGLKLRFLHINYKTAFVAPHAGAWIETQSPLRLTKWMQAVAPHAGAWIETSGAPSVNSAIGGRAPCGRVD